MIKFENTGDVISEIRKEIEMKKTAMVVRDVIDIYNGKYAYYKDYVAEKENIIRFNEEQQEKQSTCGKPDELKIFIDPTILSEEVYTTALAFGVIDRHKEDK